jgi:hypothetical protein
VKSEKETTMFEDENQMEFYQNLIDLKEYVP